MASYNRRREGVRGGPGPGPDEEGARAPPNLAAKAMKASSAHSSLSYAYSNSPSSPPFNNYNHNQNNHGFSVRPSPPKDPVNYEYTPRRDPEPKQGFWGVLARKAKAIIDDDDGDEATEHVESPRRTRLQMSDSPRRTRLQMSDTPTKGQYNYSYTSPEIHRKTESHRLKKGLDAFTSSLSNIGGTISNALEEGLSRVENRTVDIIQETRKLQIGKNTGSSDRQNPSFGTSTTWQQRQMQTNVQPQIHTDLETQLKASRDVAMAMAAKAKLLLRELKTIKADLAFAKERCAQLEEENKILRESHEKGDNPEDDDLIRLQLETLLAEKARLAQENSVFARENRFLREIVEYHQLTMQDVVYLDEGNEEVTEVYPVKVPPTSKVSSNANS